MKRWLWMSLCTVAGLALVLAGLVIPAYLRALDTAVLELAGRKSPALAAEGMAALNYKQAGVAQQLMLAANAARLPGGDQLKLALANYGNTYPRLMAWGGPDPMLERLLSDTPGPKQPDSVVPIVQVVVTRESRNTLLKALAASPDPLIRSLMACRGLTNTVLFPASTSSSGQALDTALVLAGLLAQEGWLSTGLREAAAGLASEAGRGADSQRFEQFLLDLISLGQRFNWSQMTVFLAKVDNPETLRHLAILGRKAGGDLPVLFSAVYLSGRPAEVVAYLMEYSKNGLKDLKVSLAYGAGGLKEVLRRRLPVCQGGSPAVLGRYEPLSGLRRVALEYCWLMPGFAVGAKWLCYLAGGFCLALALHFARRPATALEQPLQVPGFPAAREFLFALGFLTAVLLVTEPLLAQESQKVDFPFRLRLPTSGGVVSAGITRTNPSLMNQVNQLSLLTLLLFFVLQALIYTACLVKLAEIRRQKVPPRMKLKLLENEEHLFDAGLYLGFVGTIISLILVSLGVIRPSLMAASSSTSFGIIFVSILKIFHVRPLRRTLILENEANPS